MCDSCTVSNLIFWILILGSSQLFWSTENLAYGMDNPDISSWRQKNHLFNNLPAHIKGHVREQLMVPTIHSETLFPNLRMSVLDLVNMDLPPISSGQDAYSNISWTFSFSALPSLSMTLQFLKRSLLHPKALLPSFSTK